MFNASRQEMDMKKGRKRNYDEDDSKRNGGIRVDSQKDHPRHSISHLKEGERMVSTRISRETKLKDTPKHVVSPRIHSGKYRKPLAISVASSSSSSTQENKDLVQSIMLLDKKRRQSRLSSRRNEERNRQKLKDLQNTKEVLENQNKTLKSQNQAFRNAITAFRIHQRYQQVHSQCAPAFVSQSSSTAIFPSASIPATAHPSMMMPSFTISSEGLQQQPLFLEHNQQQDLLTQHQQNLSHLPSSFGAYARSYFQTISGVLPLVQPTQQPAVSSTATPVTAGFAGPMSTFLEQTDQSTQPQQHQQQQGPINQLLLASLRNRLQNLLVQELERTVAAPEALKDTLGAVLMLLQLSIQQPQYPQPIFNLNSELVSLLTKPLLKVAARINSVPPPGLEQEVSTGGLSRSSTDALNDLLQLIAQPQSTSGKTSGNSHAQTSQYQCSEPSMKQGPNCSQVAANIFEHVQQQQQQETMPSKSFPSQNDAVNHLTSASMEGVQQQVLSPLLQVLASIAATSTLESDTDGEGIESQRRSSSTTGDPTDARSSFSTASIILSSSMNGEHASVTDKEDDVLMTDHPSTSRKRLDNSTRTHAPMTRHFIY